HGPHALRHSLASALPEKKVPLPAISEALGHASTGSTAIYLKIEFVKLQHVSLPVGPCTGRRTLMSAQGPTARATWAALG
ncbi:tyrosine-type recombinase/integrase, partial [Arthrobacter sp. NPDC080031]|uniref:tyrosine-type recombinase/integrase n=1 Tax=Arthrobacter sp. NPDC080031 TaxID=3155918 RepID=UPI00344B2389